MKTELVQTLTATFEGHAQQAEDGIEYWLARGIQHLLGYSKWENFLNVVSKAKTACEVSGHKVSDHFPDVGKMVDLGSGSQREVEDIIRQLDAFLPSEMETRAFFGGALDDLWQAAEAFGALGTKCVVLKLGARGQFVYDAQTRRRWHVPAYPSQVVDVTGAGDAYCGGFLVGLTATGDPLEAALLGCVSASLVVEGTGALYALSYTPKQLAARLEHVRRAVKTI